MPTSSENTRMVKPRNSWATQTKLAGSTLATQPTGFPLTVPGTWSKSQKMLSWHLRDLRPTLLRTSTQTSTRKPKKLGCPTEMANQNTSDASILRTQQLLLDSKNAINPERPSNNEQP